MPLPGRTCIDLIGLAGPELENMVQEYELDIKVAVMGWPTKYKRQERSKGEADLGICRRHREDC